MNFSFSLFFFLVDLVGLLRWKAKKREIPAVLTSLLKIDGEEIVKVRFSCSCVSWILYVKQIKLTGFGIFPISFGFMKKCLFEVRFIYKRLK